MTRLALEKPLEHLHSLIKKKGSHVLHTSELVRIDREILLKNHWLEEIMRGWYLVIRPDLMTGDSTVWYANFWEFLREYLCYHYENDYCLSAESSLDLYTGNTTIPKQVIVMAKKGSGTSVSLPFDTSLLVYADPERLPSSRHVVRGLQVMTLGYALCKVSSLFFQKTPQEAKIALQLIQDPSELLQVLVDSRFKSAAGRLLGAYKALKNVDMVEALQNGLLEVGMKVQSTNPFAADVSLTYSAHHSPYSARLESMWDAFRPTIMKLFPKAPGLPVDATKYLTIMDGAYIQDAYNSLSIEGYQVTEKLIEKVRQAKWNPEQHLDDKNRYNALSARGYYEAFMEVRCSVEKIIQGSDAGSIVSKDLQRWYQRLFHPLVQAGLLKASDLFGYRKQQVYIRSSRHTPLPKEALMDSMQTFFQLLQKENEPSVRAVLGHFIFVFIHPYMDGNGRIARFLMNAMLASGGYPWTILPVARREEYMTSLEQASVQHDILPFVSFLVSELPR